MTIQRKGKKLLSGSVTLVLLSLVLFLNFHQPHPRLQNYFNPWRQQEDRLEHLRHECQEYGKGATNASSMITVRRESFAIDRQHRLTFCWNHKAASTSWFHVFSQLTNSTQLFTIDSLYKLAPYLAPSSAKDLQDHLTEKDFKFTTVRHPYHRLVSAFRDRFLLHPDSHQARRWLPLMQRQAHAREDGPPTFRHFVDFLLATDPSEYDTHWRPMWRQCNPCDVSYDKIIKVETMKSDFEEMQLQMPLLRHFKLEHLHKHLDIDAEAEDKLVQAHLMQLDPDKRLQLFHVYERDFRLFDYHP